jgi:hypothetical protein
VPLSKLRGAEIDALRKEMRGRARWASTQEKSTQRVGNVMDRLKDI